MAARVAILGTGRMGGTMAATLVKAGFEVVVWNRTAARARAVARETGAEVAPTAAAAGGAAETVIVSLADDAAVIEAFSGPDGGAAELDDGTVVLQTSTIDPRTLDELEPLVSERGATLLDSPVSGSLQLAEQGALTVIVGGPAHAVSRARPVLDALASQVFHVGGLGAGATIKLAVNAILHAINIALSEALVLAEKSGVDRRTAYEVIASSAAGGPFVHYKRPAFEDPANTPPVFSLDLMAKDMDLILGLAERLGVSMSQGDANREVVLAAIESGMGQEDMSAIASYLRER